MMALSDARLVLHIRRVGELVRYELRAEDLGVVLVEGTAPAMHTWRDRLRVEMRHPSDAEQRESSGA